jgi:hypothetical protein
VAPDSKRAASGSGITTLEWHVAPAGVKQHQARNGGSCKRCKWSSRHEYWLRKSHAICKGAVARQILEKSHVV